MLASASNAIIIGFNVRPVRRRARGRATARASRSAATRSSTRSSRSCAPRWRACSSPRRSRRPSAPSRSAQTFKASKVGTIAGSIRHRAARSRRGATVRLVRDGTIVYDGKIGSLRRFKEDVREVDHRHRVRHRARELRRREGGRRARGVRDPPGREDPPVGIWAWPSRMPADRMRRVNEALREVLSGRIADGLKDPRIGFVTVTAVETSSDLRHARVYVSVLGDEQERADTLAGLESLARLPAGRDRPRAADQAHARAASSSTTRRSSAAMRISQLLDEAERGGPEPVSRVGTELDHVVEELRSADKLLLTTHENPDGDALGSLLGMHGILSAARQGLPDVPVAGRVPAAARVPRHGARRDRRRPAGRHGRARGRSSSTAATSTGCRSTSCRREGIHILNIDHHHDNTRFGTVEPGRRATPPARRRSSGGWRRSSAPS